MTNLCRCACCDGALEPAQQLRFLVETDNLDNPSYLDRIRALPSVNGRPVPVCKACQTRIETHPVVLKSRPKAAPLSLTTGLLGALGALSVGWLLGNLFTSRG
ncbi:MAG: hypothetical protein J0I06_03965 [Planctomycetes bacterium]|nr:hypothetical protein [Planctomycetota bacterium]